MNIAFKCLENFKRNKYGILIFLCILIIHLANSLCMCLDDLTILIMSNRLVPRPWLGLNVANLYNQSFPDIAKGVMVGEV